jgi:hypothetical protein
MNNKTKNVLKYTLGLPVLLMATPIIAIFILLELILTDDVSWAVFLYDLWHPIQ